MPGCLFAFDVSLDVAEILNFDDSDLEEKLRTKSDIQR